MHRIEIKDFFAVQDATIEIGKAVLLIGPQASGKSTICKLVYYFKSLRQDFLTIVYQYVADPKLTTIDTTTLRESFWFESRQKFIK